MAAVYTVEPILLDFPQRIQDSRVPGDRRTLQILSTQTNLLGRPGDKRFILSLRPQSKNNSDSTVRTVLTANLKQKNKNDHATLLFNLLSH